MMREFVYALEGLGVGGRSMCVCEIQLKRN